jgi:hypothetical protein
MQKLRILKTEGIGRQFTHREQNPEGGDLGIKFR